jgi:adenosylcobinamide-GDP ribazoletransferase
MRGALGFLTAFGGAAVPDRRSVVWFGPVGGLVGLLVGLVWWGAGELWPALLAAVLAVVADAALTGMLHLDGLADTADGLLPPLDRPRRLAVMSDPQAGVFAVVALTLVLALQVTSLALLTPDPLLIAALWAASRAAMGLTLSLVPYARAGTALDPTPTTAADPAPRTSTGPSPAPTTGGLASVFVGTPPWPSAVAGAAALAAAALAGGWPAGPAAAVALVAGAGGVVVLARHRLGGFTGDVLGAAGVVGQTCALVVAAARW